MLLLGSRNSHDHYKYPNTKFQQRSINAVISCPICNFKTFSEKDEKEHAKTHQKPAPALSAEPTAKKIEEPKKPFEMPDFIKRFLHKTVSITLIDGSTISGELTGFNN